MPDYKNGKIYTIRCNSNTDFIYIGSTCQTLSRRWQDHKKDVNHRDSKVYKIIRENGGIDNFYIELYEDFSCERKEQLLQREGEIMRQIGNMSMNTIIAGTFAGKTQAEYDKERDKTEHRQNYKKLYGKKYLETHREENKEYHKQWYENNKEAQKEAVREYNIVNREKIKERRGTKIECKCGSIICKGDISKHYKSLKHQNFINCQKEEEN